MDVSLPQGFQQIKVKYNSKCTFGHNIYFKQHVTKLVDPEKPSARTLMVCNIPPYITFTQVKHIFGRPEEIESICEYATKNDQKSIVEETEDDERFFKPTLVGFYTCFVIFKEPESLTKALNNIKKEFICKNTTSGILKWCDNYVKYIPNEKELLKNVDNYMAKYDQIIEEQEKLEKDMANEPDEDGWVKVTKKGNVPVASRSELNETALKKKSEKKRKLQEALNVYSFQVRESKRQQIAELRQKFEEDKLKIQQMRESRKFKPF